MKWQENAAPVTEQSIAAAISWVEKLTFEQALSQAICMDALLEAGKDKTVSVYSGLAQVTKLASSLFLHAQYLHSALQLILVSSQWPCTGATLLTLKSL